MTAAEPPRVRRPGAAWRKCPYTSNDYVYSPVSLKKHWARLHAGDAEPLPDSEAVRAAWALFHAGDFQLAMQAGLKAGGPGLSVANKAQAVYANYLSRSERQRLNMFLEVADRAEAQIDAEPDNPSAHYWRAYALGRYSQTISIVKALAQGLGVKVKQSLEATLRLAPTHADAHIALGTYHAEVIDKLGKLLARAQGADGATALRLFAQALRLNPHSAIARTEYAHALMMIDGDTRLDEVEGLYAAAAACTPVDAKERLDVEMAKAELLD